MRISDWSSDVCSFDLPDEGAHAGDHLRRDRAAAGLHRPAAGRGPLRPPGRDAVRLAADQLLAGQAAFQPQRVAGAAVLGLSAFESNRVTSISRAFAPCRRELLKTGPARTKDSGYSRSHNGGFPGLLR